MTKLTLDFESLRVDSFCTVSVPLPPVEDKASAVTSCPRRPYCTC